MKSEQEIKDFIDSKEALTFNELQRFVKGRTTGNPSELERRMWSYVLATKDCKTLREYKLKVYTHNIELSFDEFNKIYNKDERFQKYGRRRIRKLLMRRWVL